MDCIVHRVTKSRTWLSNSHFRDSALEGLTLRAWESVSVCHSGMNFSEEGHRPPRLFLSLSALLSLSCPPQCSLFFFTNHSDSFLPYIPCSFKNIIIIIWPHRVAYGTLVPWPGIKPLPLAIEAQSLTHWTPREVPQDLFREKCVYPYGLLTLWEMYGL